MTDALPGTCFAMCPAKERWMREREGLLHPLEIDESTKHLRRPKADSSKIVKCFSRPAAGKEMLDVSELRPAPVLLVTLNYLMKNVATRSDLDWSKIYEFIFDRLRAIRQDLVIQRISILASIELYVPMVRFHIYASERLCDRRLEEFVPKFNNQHLLECIKHLLVLYDDKDKQEHCHFHEKLEYLTVCDNRAQIEALYILLYLGEREPLQRGLSLPKKYRETEEVSAALEISLSWHLRNYVRACRIIANLSPLMACAALTNLPKIKRDALCIMSSGYNSQVLTFPGLKLQEMLLYTDISMIEKDCKLFNLTFTQQNVQFQKSKFKESESLANVEKHFKETSLHNFLPDILIT